MVAASTAFSPSSTMTASLVESAGLPSAAIPVHEDGNNGNGDSSADGSGDDGGMVRSLSLWNYFTMGFGAIIGTVWVLLVGDWMIVGGGPVEAMIAFVLGAVFLLPIGSTSGAVTMVGSFLPGVLVMTPLFYTGFDTIPQSAEEASEGLDWKKFGMVISASLLAAGLIIIGLQVLPFSPAALKPTSWAIVAVWICWVWHCVGSVHVHGANSGAPVGREPFSRARPKAYRGRRPRSPFCACVPTVAGNTPHSRPR